ncbi:unnamed protein product [Clavelina lepadiformis]|uniref:Tyrosine-protein kinase n=1 Tax=Clavelina lepadiformis TaxID=159417 RepID=A0ABP0GLA7_CLALP
MDDNECEKLMLKQGKHGDFMIRLSSVQNKEPGQQSLSLREPSLSRTAHFLSVLNCRSEAKQVFHYQIINKDLCHLKGFEKQEFNSIADLVLHYQNSLIQLTPNLRGWNFDDTYEIPMRSEDKVICCPPFFSKRTEPGIGKVDQINRSNIIFQKTLGNFVMGDVSKGRLIGSGKVLIHTITWGTVQNTLLEQTLESLNEIQHKNIAKIYGMVLTEKPFRIVTEYLCNGNLQDYFRSELGLESVYRHHLYMAAQVASGMAYLEANSVIHGDLRGENILVGQNNLCKISGIKLTELCVNSGGFPFLPAWSAPEVQDTKNFTHKSDVWSFGILLYVIFTKGDSPYPGIKRHEVLDKVRGGYRMSKPVTNPSFPDDVFHTMRDCWHVTDVMRPKFRFLMDFLKKCLTDYDRGKAEDEHIYQQI